MSNTKISVAIIVSLITVAITGTSNAYIYVAYANKQHFNNRCQKLKQRFSVLWPKTQKTAAYRKGNGRIECASKTVAKLLPLVLGTVFCL
jgi:hypothetical protein